MASWHFVTASEPRSAGESSATAHSHCGPGPCLHVANAQGVKLSESQFLCCHQPINRIYAFVGVHINCLNITSEAAIFPLNQAKMSHKCGDFNQKKHFNPQCTM